MVHGTKTVSPLEKRSKARRGYPERLGTVAYVAAYQLAAPACIISSMSRVPSANPRPSVMNGEQPSNEPATVLQELIEARHLIEMLASGQHSKRDTVSACREWLRLHMRPRRARK